MAYRNKTYVAFASDDIHCYQMMEAWRDNQHIEFDFIDAHDLNVALDTSRPDTIRRRLRERLAHTKQVVILVSNTTRPKSARSSSFLYYEVETIDRLDLPIVFANLNGSREVQRDKLPTRLLQRYSICVSFQPAIIRYASDDYVSVFNANVSAVTARIGPHYYEASVYQQLGL